MINYMKSWMNILHSVLMDECMYSLVDVRRSETGGWVDEWAAGCTGEF